MNSDHTILVVEDNDFVRMQIMTFLKNDGFNVIESHDGEEALKIMDDTISIAIVDLRMEPLDGFEFIRSIRGSNMDTPVILATGDQNPDILSEASKWNVDAVLMKPIEKDRLIKTITRILQVKQRKLG